MSDDDLIDIEPTISNSASSVPRRPQKCNNFEKFCREAQAVTLPSHMKKSLTLSPFYSPTNEDSYMEQCFDDIKYLAEGTFGTVFKAKSKDDGKLYAVKKWKRRFTNKNQRNLRLQEIRRYASISSSQFCVELIRAWEEKAFLYLQMELCSCSLKQLAAKNDLLEDTLWKILLDLLLALAHIHSHKFIHLDIKPDNILVSPNNVFKLSDFDLLLDLSKGPVDDGEDGDSRYLAPELLRGVFTYAADIFSLGITLFEVGSSLELPSHGRHWQDLRCGILPCCRFSCHSKELTDLVRLMMLPEPEDRPSAFKLLKNKKLSKMRPGNRVQNFIRDVASRVKLFCSDSKIAALKYGVRVFKPIVTRCPALWKKNIARKKACEMENELDIGCPSENSNSLKRDSEPPTTLGGRQENSEGEVANFRTRLVSCRKRLNFDDEVEDNADNNNLASPNGHDGSDDGAASEVSSPKKRRLFD